MVQDYRSRLRIALKGAEEVPRLFTSSGVLFSEGYRRVVIGGRGPYVEYGRQQIACRRVLVPDQHYYYNEWRSEPDKIKIYEQRHRVSYADYVPGLLYVSPFDLWLDTGLRVIDPIGPLHEPPKQGSLF